MATTEPVHQTDPGAPAHAPAEKNEGATAQGIGLQGLIQHPKVGELLLQAAKTKLEGMASPDPKSDKPAEGNAANSIGQVNVSLNPHLPPVQLNLHANQAPTAAFAPVQYPQNGQPNQSQPPPNMSINLEALLGMFCGGRPNSGPSVQHPGQNGAAQPHPTQGTTQNQHPVANSQNNGASNLFGFLKSMPFMNTTPQPAPVPGNPNVPPGQLPSNAPNGASRQPLVFQKIEGSKENELTLLQPSQSTREGTLDGSGQQNTANPPPLTPRAPFQPTVPAGVQTAPVQAAQPAPFIDLGSLLGMFCGGHNNQSQQQAGNQSKILTLTHSISFDNSVAIPHSQSNQRQGFNMNFFRNFSFTGNNAHQQGSQPGLQPGESHPGQVLQPQQAGTNLAAISNTLLSSIEYRQNQGFNLNLGNVMGGRDLAGELERCQQENQQLKERLTQLEQEHVRYSVPATSIGIDFAGYTGLVEEVNSYCKEFKAELSQAQLDYINGQLKDSFEARVSALFREVKFNTKEEMTEFLGHSHKTLESLKAVRDDLSARLGGESVTLDAKDKAKLLEPLELQISSLEKRDFPALGLSGNWLSWGWRVGHQHTLHSHPTVPLEFGSWSEC